MKKRNFNARSFALKMDFISNFVSEITFISQVTPLDLPLFFLLNYRSFSLSLAKFSSIYYNFPDTHRGLRTFRRHTPKRIHLNHPVSIYPFGLLDIILAVLDPTYFHRNAAVHSEVHSFKSPSRSFPFPAATPSRRSPSFLFFSPSASFSPHLRRHALCSHDVTRVGITHRHEGRVVYQRVRMCQDRREGRDSFEPRLVFASPCVPRTSYFNETVCLPLSLSLFLIFSLSLFFSLSLSRTPHRASSLLFSSHHLAGEPTDRQTGRSFVSHRSSLFLLLLLSCFYIARLCMFLPSSRTCATIKKGVAPPAY